MEVSIFWVKVFSFNYTVSSFQLYSIKYGENTVEEAINTLQTIEENIPNEYLPIGTTSTGNEITILLKENQEKNPIFLFRYDELLPIRIADSLEELFGVQDIDEL